MSALPVSKKERERRGKNGFGPGMKNGHANLMQNNLISQVVEIGEMVKHRSSETRTGCGHVLPTT